MCFFGVDLRCRAHHVIIEWNCLLNFESHQLSRLPKQKQLFNELALKDAPLALTASSAMFVAIEPSSLTWLMTLLPFFFSEAPIMDKEMHGSQQFQVDAPFGW